MAGRLGGGVGWNSMSKPSLIIKETLFLIHCEVSPGPGRSAREGPRGRLMPSCSRCARGPAWEPLPFLQGASAARPRCPPAEFQGQVWRSTTAEKQRKYQTWLRHKPPLRPKVERRLQELQRKSVLIFLCVEMPRKYDKLGVHPSF